MISGVSPSGPGSSAGSPIGGVPSGSSVRGEVAVHAEGLDQRHRRGHVVQHVRRDGARALLALGGGRRLHQLVAHGGELEALVDQVVEAFVAVQQVLERRQERARLGALDHPVVVGAGDRHDLADAELAEPLLGNARELRRIADRADRDDAPLARHEPRHRGDGAEPAGIGERHGGAGEVVRHQPVGAGLLHQRLVGGVERGEVQRLGALDHRHHEAPAPVLPLHVHREARARSPRAGPGRARRPARARVWPMTGCCLVAWTSA